MRDASTYRGARRNSYVSPAAGHGRFFGWNAWREANKKANLYERIQMTNSAREAAAKALVNNQAMRPDIVAGKALLHFYLTEVKRTRSISRIIRELQERVRAVKAFA